MIMNTTNKSMYSNKGFNLMDKSQKSDLNNRHLNNALRISQHLIQQDIKSHSRKLSLLALERYYMIKYLKSLNQRVGRNIKKSCSMYFLRLQASFSYALRKFRVVVKYVSELSRSQIIKDFTRFPNVTILHCERFKNPSIIDVISEFKCRIIELYRYKIPNYIQYKRGKY